MLRLLLFTLVFIAFEQITLAQTETADTSSKIRIEILNADVLEIENTGETEYRKLRGNVIMQQGDATMYCDSADLSPEINFVKAYSNVQIIQDDSTKIFADTLIYEGNSRIATLIDSVKLVQGKMSIETDSLTYDMNTKTGNYTTGGILKDKTTRLTSKKGTYYSELKKALFSDSVRVEDAQYTLENDTLEYFVEEQKSYFFGPTNIINGENTIYCENGWFNNSEQTGFFQTDAKLFNKESYLSGERIFYNSTKQQGWAEENVVIVDSVQKSVITCDSAFIDDAKNYFYATINPVLKIDMDGDSLFVTADVLESFGKDSVRIHKLLAYDSVKIYKSDFQVVCDSLAYMASDSTFQFYQDPAIWTQSSQFTADTMFLVLKNKQPESIEMLNDALVVESLKNDLYNQVYGVNGFGKFKDGKMKRMNFIKSAESVYYMMDGEQRFMGVNDAEADSLFIRFGEEKIQKISFLSKPTATFYPIKQANHKELELKHFVWRIKERPRTKFDILGINIAD